MAPTAEATEEKVEQQGQEQAGVQAQSVEFTEAGGGKATGGGTSIDLLLDIDVPVIVTIGQAEIPVQQLLQLGPGSVLKLDKPIDAPVDLYLQDVRFASGSIVVVDGKFAVRIKEILNSGTTASANKK